MLFICGRFDILITSLNVLSLSVLKMCAQGDIGSHENPEETMTVKEALARVAAIVLTMVYVIGVCAAKDYGYVLTDQEEDQLESIC